ncbi:MAG TPA: DUF1080 domain-containing protein [Terriglobia bacterium]|nr:DUF1080 domain-containing protein [Terriglobia bacterium]
MRHPRFLVAAVFAVALATGMGASIAPAVTPGKSMKLFNGKNLDGFYTYLKSKGKNQDPDKVFQVHDGMIHVSGTEFGYFATEAEYENYRLTVEFKWGEKTHAPREGKARDSGILYHFVGPDKIFPKSIEFQMIEGGTGDVIVVDGASLTVGGVTRTEGRFDRFGKGPWEDVVGYRDPKNEVEKPHGEWNLLELVASGDAVKYYVNGKLVNEGVGANPRRGKILFQSEGAELFFRKIELEPLKE